MEKFCRGKKDEEIRDEPAKPEGEGSPENLSREDAEDGREEAEEQRSAGLEEDGVGQAEGESQSVEGDIKRDSPNSQTIRPLLEELESCVFVQTQSHFPSILLRNCYRSHQCP